MIVINVLILKWNPYIMICYEFLFDTTLVPLLEVTAKGL